MEERNGTKVVVPLSAALVSLLALLSTVIGTDVWFAARAENALRSHADSEAHEKAAKHIAELRSDVRWVMKMIAEVRDEVKAMRKQR